MPTPSVFAHRGASRVEVENTIEAFETAKKMGAHGVELDVRLSADGLLVVHHDPELADGRSIAGLTGSELPPHVPFLETVLDVCSAMIVNIEIKNSRHEPDHDPTQRAARQVVEAAAAKSITASVLVSSFSMGAIDVVRELDRRIKTAYISGIGVEAIDRATSRGHRVVHPEWRTVDEAFMAEARLHGVEVNVYTVDEPDEMLRLRDLGVDGICTNVPDIALATLGF